MKSLVPLPENFKCGWCKYPQMLIIIVIFTKGYSQNKNEKSGLEKLFLNRKYGKVYS